MTKPRPDQGSVHYHTYLADEHAFNKYSVYNSGLCLITRVYRRVKADEWHQRNRGNVSLTMNKFDVDRKRVREWSAKCS